MANAMPNKADTYKWKERDKISFWCIIACVKTK
jgi:hypothetical protein